MGGSNGQFLHGQAMTQPMAARWMESLRNELMHSLGQSNRTHVLTAWRMMAWEDVLVNRRFGFFRSMFLWAFRPKALLALVVARHNELMKEQERLAQEQADREAVVVAQIGGQNGGISRGR